MTDKQPTTAPAAPAAATAEASPKTAPRANPKPLPPYHVVLLDDNDHSYEYVILMCSKLFRHPFDKGWQIACEVDAKGRAILLTTTKEHAELKRDQVHGYGADPLLGRSAGSMTATIEPAVDG